MIISKYCDGEKAMAILLTDLGMEPKEGENIKGTGWRPELPDLRDYTLLSSEVADILAPLKLDKAAVSTLPASVNLEKWCSPIEDQGELGSCTANAGVGSLSTSREGHSETISTPPGCSFIR